MMERRNKPNSLSTQMQRRTVGIPKLPEKYDGDFGRKISTGSTLLDLAISGGRVRGGGLPGGILVEIFGPSGSGKTVLLSEIAGAIQRQGGEIMFHDPEARLNKQFAKLFDLDTDTMAYSNPDTVPEVFQAVRDWQVKDDSIINGVMADSLAALSTDMEMEAKEGDKMGMRRAKEFSEELRKTCRILTKNNYLMVCSNQVRENLDAGPYGQKFKSPGGEAIGFYSSLRLRTLSPEKIKEKRTIAGKEVFRVSGVKIQVEVFKSSIWKPYRTAPIIILFDYGIDDIRANLQFLKEYSHNTTYTIAGRSLSNKMDDAVKMIEEEHLEEALRQDVILLWNDIEFKFANERKPKR
jgi:protein RecA